MVKKVETFTLGVIITSALLIGNINNALAINNDIEYDDYGNEIINTGDEYDYPPLINEHCTDTTIVNQDILNELIGYEGYKSFNVRVKEDTRDKDYDVQVSLDVSNILRGTQANKLLESYNRHVMARYLIDTDQGWENVLIPFKLNYKEALDDTNYKIEPIFRIYESMGYSVYYNELEYTPIVNTLYILKSREERIGYIATKLPISKTSKYTLEIQDLNLGDYNEGIKLKLDSMN